MTSNTLGRPVTIQDVAMAVGVSKSTASAALTGNGRISESTRQAVLMAAARLGFEANPHAQRLSNGGCRNTIGLFVLGMDLGVGTLKVHIIQHLLSSRGYHVPLYAYGTYGANEVHRQGELMRTLRRQRPAAILCATHFVEPDTLHELELYQAEGGIVVCYDNDVDFECDKVLYDRGFSTAQTTRHLLELGHRRLGLYMEGDNPPKGPRRHAFETALQEFGALTKPDWMFFGGSNEAGGECLAQQFLTLQDRPTGICVVNDRAASAFINIATRNGLRVPEDISVVCHDDQPVARTSYVPLSSGIHPVERIAEEVVHLASSRIDGTYSGSYRRVMIDGELIQRASTAPPQTA